jgi:hypothetical protein
MNTNTAPASRPAGTTRASVGRLWTTLRTEVHDLRAARAERRQLRRDLAAYDTPAAIDDLLAAVGADGDRHPEIVAILSENRDAYFRRLELRHGG